MSHWELLAPVRPPPMVQSRNEPQFHGDVAYRGEVGGLRPELEGGQRRTTGLGANYQVATSELLRAQVAEVALREEALQSTNKLQLEEQRAHSIVDRLRLDSESRVEIFKGDLMNAQASEQACQSFLEDERAACCELMARLAVSEMRIHDGERAPAGRATSAAPLVPGGGAFRPMQHWRARVVQ